MKRNGIILSLLFLFGTNVAFADNEIYIDQVGGTSEVVIEQDGASNVVAGESGSGDKFLLSGNNLNINMRTVGSSNNIFGNIIGADTVLDLDINGSSNDFLFDVDKDNAYGATGGDFQIDITGGNNDFDFDFGSNDTANNADFDFILDGDFNAMNVAVDVSDIVLNWDLQMSNSTFDYTATGYDGHSATITGDGDYMNIDIVQESTLKADSIEIDFDGNGTSTSNSVICIQQSDSGTATSGCGN